MIDLTLCQTGLARHAPTLPERLGAAGATLSTVECFDRCETCERALLARVDGAMMRFRDEAELLAALDALRAAP